MEGRKPDRASESEAILARRNGDLLIACDERGENLSSRALADRLTGWRDGGHRRILFAVGGADGHDPSLREAAQMRLAFGAQTWPHGLVRAMLAEQIYRATTLIAGLPYHRD